MDILFVHNNFPGQFEHLARVLAAVPGLRVFALGAETARLVPGVTVLRYRAPKATRGAAPHPFAQKFDADCRRAEQAFYVAHDLLSRGVSPKLIIVHPGWGEALPLRELFPAARIVVYCEFYYHSAGADVGFDPEFDKMGADGRLRVRGKNAATLLSLSECDLGLAPTAWQRGVFPSDFHGKIQVAHEGVDTDVVRPNDQAFFTLSSETTLTPSNNIITFVARNLEPYRGYHVFMRSLPDILEALPDAQVLIAGGSGTSYGRPPSDHKTWQKTFLDEVSWRIDLSRVHFLGKLEYPNYIQLLQVSTAHVYLTYPFVLSWSAVEAMAAGCLLIGSDTGPVREVVTDGENGVLVPFFDAARLAQAVIEAVRHRDQYRPLRQRARVLAVEQFDRNEVCLPRQLDVLFPGLEPAEHRMMVGLLQGSQG